MPVRIEVCASPEKHVEAAHGYLEREDFCERCLARRTVLIGVSGAIEYGRPRGFEISPKPSPRRCLRLRRLIRRIWEG
jgi:hypothetical protein